EGKFAGRRIFLAATRLEPFCCTISPMKSCFPAFLLVLMLCTQPAFGHPVPFSYLDLQLQGRTIDASLVVHIYDLGHDLDVVPMERLLDPTELAKREASIRALVTERLKLEVDGRRLTGEWLPPEIIADRQSLRLHWQFSVDAEPRSVAVETVMFP